MSPCFSKRLCKSHVEFYMRISKEFSDTHLPCHDDTIVLVNQSGREYNVVYGVKENRLQRGWRNFVRANGLREGDTLVFELIEPCKFKVSVKRTRRSIGINGTRTGQSHQVPGVGAEYQVPKSSAKESLPASSKKRSPETYLVCPKGKTRLGMDRMVKLQCGNILRELMNHPYGYIFSHPVDPVQLHIPDYFSVISEPMDLGTIKEKLDGDKLSSMDEFAADVRLTFSNAMWYNPSDHEVYEWADHLNGYFEKKWKSLVSKLKHKGPTSCNDDSQDSWQSVRENFQDSEKEGQIGVDARARKVNHVKMVKNPSNTGQKAKCSLCRGLVCHCGEKDAPDQAFSSDPSPGRSSVHNLCADSEMNNIMLSGSKKGGDDKVVPQEKMKHVIIKSAHRSTATNGSDEYTWIVKKEFPDTTTQVSSCDSTPLADQSLRVENSESGIRIKGFADFVIYVNGEILDSEIPPDVRMKYYQLCCSQKKLIHDRVVKGLSRKLVVAMILEIVRIAGAIRVASFSTSPDDLECMEKALKSFQDLGMEVGSLHAKLCMLIKFSKKHQTLEESTRVEVAELVKERTTLQETNSKINELTESAREIGELIGHLEVKIKALKEKREKLRFVFKEVAGLSW